MVPSVLLFRSPVLMGSHSYLVVSTVVSGVLFTRYCTVEYVPAISSFLCDVKNFRETNEREHTALTSFSLWVAGSTHIVLLAKNVILGKECEENNSPTHRK